MRDQPPAAVIDHLIAFIVKPNEGDGLRRRDVIAGFGVPGLDILGQPVEGDQVAP
jgi:hypothetical protein